MAKPNYLEPGNYIVRVTRRQRIKIEEGEKKTEMDLAEEAAYDCDAEMVDWEVE